MSFLWPHHIANSSSVCNEFILKNILLAGITAKAGVQCLRPGYLFIVF